MAKSKEENKCTIDLDAVERWPDENIFSHSDWEKIISN